MNIEIGYAYDLSDIAGDNGLLWICLSRSKANDRILNLSPAMTEKPFLPAVEVESSEGSKAWLIPAISTPIHEIDLEKRRVHSKFEMSRPAEIDLGMLMNPESTEEQTANRLQKTAWEIAQYFHANPDRYAVPDIADCFVVNEEKPTGSLVFAWSHDQSRRYELRADPRGGASLEQKYDAGGDVRGAVDIPLKIGKKTLNFDDNGLAKRKIDATEFDHIWSALGLETKEKTIGRISGWNTGGLATLWQTFGNWRVGVAAGLTAGIVVTVILLQQVTTPRFEIYNAYATTSARTANQVELGIILELRTPNVPKTTEFFVDTAKDAGIEVTVEYLPGGVVLVTGNGRIESSDKFRRILAERGIDLKQREFIEIAIEPLEE